MVQVSLEAELVCNDDLLSGTVARGLPSFISSVCSYLFAPLVDLSAFFNPAAVKM